MGRKRGAKRKGKRKKEEDVRKEEEKEEEEVQEGQGGLSEDSCKSPSLDQEQMEVELELRLLEALEIYPPAKLRGIHRHFVLYGLTDYLQRSFNKNFTADDVLKLLDRFYNLEMLEPDDEVDILNQEEEFYLPPSFFAKEDS